MTTSKLNENPHRIKAKPKRSDEQSFAPKAAEARDPDRRRGPGKLDLMRNLLAQPGGATIDELVSATSWQPHSVRAGMTGLRKQGLSVTREKVDGTTHFAIAVQPGKAEA